MIRSVPVDSARLSVVATGHVEPVMKWDRSGDRAVQTDVQERDEITNLLLWTIYLMVAAGDRPEVVAVRVPAEHQPVVTPLGSIDLHGLEVGVRVGRDGKLAGYWSAVGVADPAQMHGGKRPHQEKQAEGQAA